MIILIAFLLIVNTRVVITTVLRFSKRGSLVEEVFHHLRSRTDLRAQRHIRRTFLMMLVIEMFTDVIGTTRIPVVFVVHRTLSVAVILSRLHVTIFSARALTNRQQM